MWTFQLRWAGWACAVFGLVSSQVLNEYINPFWLGNGFDTLDRDSYRRGKWSPYGYRYNNNNDDYYFTRGDLYHSQDPYRSNRFDYQIYKTIPFYNQDYRRYPNALRDQSYLRRQPDIYSDDVRRNQQLLAARADIYRNHLSPDSLSEISYREANQPRYNLQVLTDEAQPQLQSLGMETVNVRQRLTRSDKKQLAH